METAATPARTTAIAELVSVEASSARVLFDGRVLEAELALPTLIGVKPGSQALMLQHEDRWLVVGILGGAKDRFHVEGDFCIRASGRLSLESAQEIVQEAPQVTTRANVFQIFAGEFLSRASRALHWVAERLETQAGDMLTRVEGEARRDAGTIVENARENVSIDGQRIDLG